MGMLERRGVLPRGGARVLAALAFLAVLIVGSRAAPRPRAEVGHAAIEAHLQAIMRRAHVPGLVASIVRPTGTDRFVLGVADVDAGTLMHVDGRFELGSNSKAFTGLAIRLLEVRGLIDLDAPVVAYLPWLTLTHAGQSADLRVRDLLFHTAGLRFQTIAHVRRHPEANELEATVRSLVGERTLFAPGERFAYATVGYDVLGLLIERVSGMRYAEFIARELLEPMGLRATWAPGTPPPSGTKVRGHKLAFGQARPFDAPTYPGHLPAAYIESTVEDVERWLAIVGGSVAVSPELSEAIHRALQPDQSVPPDASYGTFYASGWFYHHDWGVRIAHPGSNPSFSSCVSVRPTTGEGIIVLANLNANDVVEACRSIDELLHTGSTGEVDDLYRTVDRVGTVIVLLGALGCAVLLLAIAWRVHLHRAGLRRIDWREALAPPRIVVYGTAVLLSAIGTAAVPSLIFAGLSFRVLLEWGPGSLPIAQAVGWGVAALALAHRFLGPYRENQA